MSTEAIILEPAGNVMAEIVALTRLGMHPNRKHRWPWTRQHYYEQRGGAGASGAAHAESGGAGFTFTNESGATTWTWSMA